MSAQSPEVEEPKIQSMKDRLLFLYLHCVGHLVQVTLKDGTVLEGLCHSISTEEPEFAVILNHARLRTSRAHPISSKSKSKPRELMQILSADISRVDAMEVSMGSRIYHHAGFFTDTDISSRRGLAGTERELERCDWLTGEEEDPRMFMSAPADEVSLENEIRKMNKDTGWDQFGENERRFGYKSTYREELYTTRLDMSTISHADQLKAERIAREIEKGTTSNLHLALERNQLDLNAYDEETLHSSVIRPTPPPPSDPASLEGDQSAPTPGKYIPPHKRGAQSQPNPPPGTSPAAERKTILQRPQDISKQELLRQTVGAEQPLPANAMSAEDFEKQLHAVSAELAEETQRQTNSPTSVQSQPSGESSDAPRTPKVEKAPVQSPSATNSPSSTPRPPDARSRGGSLADVLKVVKPGGSPSTPATSSPKVGGQSEMASKVAPLNLDVSNPPKMKHIKQEFEEWKNRKQKTESREEEIAKLKNFSAQLSRKTGQGAHETSDSEGPQEARADVPDVAGGDTRKKAVLNAAARAAASMSFESAMSGDSLTPQSSPHEPPPSAYHQASPQNSLRPLVTDYEGSSPRASPTESPCSFPASGEDGLPSPGMDDGMDDSRHGEQKSRGLNPNAKEWKPTGTRKPPEGGSLADRSKEKPESPWRPKLKFPMDKPIAAAMAGSLAKRMMTDDKSLAGDRYTQLWVSPKQHDVQYTNYASVEDSGDPDSSSPIPPPWDAQPGSPMNSGHRGAIPMQPPTNEVYVNPSYMAHPQHAGHMGSPTTPPQPMGPAASGFNPNYYAPPAPAYAHSPANAAASPNYGSAHMPPGPQGMGMPPRNMNQSPMQPPMPPTAPTHQGGVPPFPQHGMQPQAGMQRQYYSTPAPAGNWSPHAPPPQPSIATLYSAGQQAAYRDGPHATGMPPPQHGHPHATPHHMPPGVAPQHQHSPQLHSHSMHVHQHQHQHQHQSPHQPMHTPPMQSMPPQLGQHKVANAPGGKKGGPNRGGGGHMGGVGPQGPHDPSLGMGPGMDPMSPSGPRGGPGGPPIQGEHVPHGVKVVPRGGPGGQPRFSPPLNRPPSPDGSAGDPTSPTQPSGTPKGPKAAEKFKPRQSQPIPPPGAGQGGRRKK